MNLTLRAGVGVFLLNGVELAYDSETDYSDNGDGSEDLGGAINFTKRDATQQNMLVDNGATAISTTTMAIIFATVTH